MSKSVMQMALDALEHIQRCVGFDTATIHHGSATWCETNDVIEALRAELAKPDQVAELRAKISLVETDYAIHKDGAYEIHRKLRAKIKELEQQDPVGYFVNDSGEWFEVASESKGEPLYAAPGAKTSATTGGGGGSGPKGTITMVVGAKP